MSEIKRIENAKVELICNLEGDAWKEAVKKAFKKLSSSLEVKGFRKGQVPAAIAKKHISDDQVNYEAMLNSADELLQNAIKENDLELIDRPEIRDFKATADGCTVTFGCPVEPEVTIGDLSDVKYSVEEASVTDGDVEAELDKLKEQKAEIEIKEEGALENGDISVIDFEGFKDGVPFEGGKGENFELTIGSGQFIPGFEEQLIGMNPEEERDINVTFPENYHVEDLKGQPVVFKVKLHEIKKKVLAELDEATIADLKIENVKTLDELKAYLKDNLLSQRKYENERKAQDSLLSKLVEKVEVEVPKIMIERESEQMVQDYAQRFTAQGVSLSQFLEITGQKLEDFKKGFETEAENRIKTTLALKKIALEQKLAPTAEEVDKYLNDLSNDYSMAVEEIKKVISEEQIKADLKLQKALEFLKK